MSQRYFGYKSITPIYTSYIYHYILYLSECGYFSKYLIIWRVLKKKGKKLDIRPNILYFCRKIE